MSRSAFSQAGLFMKDHTFPPCSATTIRFSKGAVVIKTGLLKPSLAKVLSDRKGGGASGEPVMREVDHGTRLSCGSCWAFPWPRPSNRVDKAIKKIMRLLMMTPSLFALARSAEGISPALATASRPPEPARLSLAAGGRLTQRFLSGLACADPCCEFSGICPNDTQVWQRR